MTEFDVSQFDPRLFEGVKKAKRAKKSNCGLTAEDVLDEDSEVWIFQCPKSIDLKHMLEGRKVSLKGETHFLIEMPPEAHTSQENTDKPVHKAYESIALPQKHKDDAESTESLVTYLPAGEDDDMKLVAAPIKGYVLFRESVAEQPVAYT